jgi:hypothetical protein
MGLTFLNSTFLFAALAALLPLIIHMLSRRQVKTVDFSSLLFLKELERRKVRRVRIRQILLLIIRSLIILCAVLALVRPTLSGLGSGTASHAKTSVAVVLDTSASMVRRSDDTPLFERARGRAEEIAQLLGDGDEAFLVSAGRPAGELLPTGTFSVDVLREALGAAEPSSSGTDYTAAIDRALALLAESRNLNRELYVVGDMQRTGWANLPEGEAAPSGGAASEGRAAPGEDAADAAPGANSPRVFLLPVESVLGNRSVQDVRVERKYGGASGALTVTASVVNHAVVSSDIPLRLVIDEVHVGQSGVSLEPGSIGTASFTTVVDDDAWHTGRVELPQDALDVDNIRHFVIPPSRRMDVLVVSAPGAPADRDAYYIKRALDPNGMREPYACAEVPTTALVYQEQGRFEVVVLADVGRLDAGAEQWLLEHLARGGGVAAVLGRLTDIRYWNGLLPSELGAGAIIEPVERRSGLRIAPAGVGHPLLAGLVFGERLIDDATVTRAFRAEPAGAEAVLELPGVGPLLTLSRPGRGGLAAVLYTGLDGAWSDLPKSGLLVPILHRTVAALAGASRTTADSEVGDDLIVPYDAASVDAPEIELPDGQIVGAERLPGTAGGAVLRGVEQAGIYRYRDGGAYALAAVNAPADESDLAPATESDIAAALEGYDWTILSADTPLAEAILVARRGRELWRVFVYAALLLVALEMWIARPRY